MSSNKITLIMAMLVLAVFALGSVSAAENVTADIDVPTEEIEIDDSVVEEVEIEDVTEDADVDDNSGNIRSSDIHVNNGMDLDSIQTAINTAESGSTIYFDSGIYTDISLTLNKSNVIYSGYGATLIGTGSNHVFTLANNLNNTIISGFNINVNDASNEYSAIYGSFITNTIIKENILSNGANGININKKYDNLTVIDNTISNMTNDGVSFAQPNANSNINALGNSYISRNNITNCKYSIFIGGNFKGVISDNNMIINDGRLTPTWGIQSAGKKNGLISNIVANITGNTISGVQTGIEFINMTAISLNIVSNTIQTTNYYTGYTVDYGENFSNATYDSINFYHNVLVGAIKQSLINMACTFDNWFDGNIIP